MCSKVEGQLRRRTCFFGTATSKNAVQTCFPRCWSANKAEVKGKCCAASMPWWRTSQERRSFSTAHAISRQRLIAQWRRSFLFRRDLLNQEWHWTRLSVTSTAAWLMPICQWACNWGIMSLKCHCVSLSLQNTDIVIVSVQLKWCTNDVLLLVLSILCR